MRNDVNVVIGISRKNDGSSVAKDLINKLKQQKNKPKAIFLFSTIDYEKNFSTILKRVKECFNDTPLIGGTISGFMSDDGCFTRGVVLLSLYGENLISQAAVGTNTKKNPKKAVSMITKKLNDHSEHDHNILIEFTSTAVVPNLPGLGQQNVVLSSLIGNQLQKLVPVMNKLNYGYDRADEILDMLAEQYSDRLIIGGCTMDDNKMLRNYQFFNDSIYQHSIVAINLSIPNSIGFKNILGFKPLDKTFHVTEISKDKHVIKKIDGESARKRFFDEIHFSLDKPQRTHQLFRKSFYYPLGYKENDIWHSAVIGIIYGDNLICGSQIKQKELTLLSLSVGSIFQNIKDHLKDLEHKKLSFLFGFACETFLETMGGKIYAIQEEFNKIKTPYLIVFLSGESFYHPQYGSHHLYESMNLFTIEKK